MMGPWSRRRWSARRIARVFALEPHQLRHLLETFTAVCVAREFLVPVSDVSLLRRQLGLPPLPHRRPDGVNGHPGGHPGISAWRTPEPARRSPLRAGAIARRDSAGPRADAGSAP
jgi:hypothetical protein